MVLLGKQLEDLKVFSHPCLFEFVYSLFEMNKCVMPADPHKHLIVLQFLHVLNYHFFYMYPELKGNHNRKR